MIAYLDDAFKSVLWCSGSGRLEREGDVNLKGKVGEVEKKRKDVVAV